MSELEFKVLVQRHMEKGPRFKVLSERQKWEIDHAIPGLVA